MHTVNGFRRQIFLIDLFHLFFPGIIYDVIVEPPSIGSTTDEHGNSRPVRYRFEHHTNRMHIVYTVLNKKILTVSFK